MANVCAGYYLCKNLIMLTWENAGFYLRVFTDLSTHGPYTSVYCWFSHDVTKIQTTKISILLRFYFHDVLEQLKTDFYTNFSRRKGSWFCDRVRLNF